MSLKRSTKDSISRAQKYLFLRFSLAITLCFTLIMLGIAVITLKQLDVEQKKLFNSIASEYQRILNNHDSEMLIKISVNNPQQMIKHKISLLEGSANNEYNKISGEDILLKTKALSNYQTKDIPWYRLISSPNYLTVLLTGRYKEFWLVLDLKPRLELFFKQWLSMAAALAILSIIISVIVYLLIRSTLSPLHRLAGIVDISSGWTVDSLAKLEKEQLGTKDTGLGDLHLSVNRLLARLISTANSMENTVDAVAHDLRTPLSRISLSAETALSTTSNNPEYSKRLQHALSDCAESAEQASQMLTTLMTIHDEILNRNSLQMEKIDLKDFIEKISNAYEEIAEDKFISISTEGLESCEIYTDTNRLSQILVNLIDNAIKYGKENGTLTLRCDKASHHAFYFEVSDDGIGIAEEHQSLIFKRLYRVDTSRRLSGYGLGLAQVEVMLDTLNGEIKVKSELNKGSTFKVILSDLSKRKSRDKAITIK